MVVLAEEPPLHYVGLMQQDPLLPPRCGGGVTPPAVHGELQRPHTPSVVRQWVAHPPAWLTVQPSRQPLSGQQFPQLGPGELEAIPLVQELHADRLLMDDLDGRRVASACGVIVTGTMGILETAAIRGLIDLPSVLTQLQATTFYASQSLYDAVLARDAARKAHRPPDG